MNNLFVCHTQAHLIFACGLSKGRFKEDKNHLILFKDFNLNEEMRSKLESLYDSTLFLTGCYPASNKRIGKRISIYLENKKKIKDFISCSYDRVFVVCDSFYPVMYCMKRCIKQNPNVEFSWLGDGILPYFQNTTVKKGLGKNEGTQFLRKLLFKYILGLGKVYGFDFHLMGGNKLAKSIYVTIPQSVRPPYNTKKIVEISSDEFTLGIQSLYERRPIEIEKGSVLLIIDKLATYQNPEAMKECLSLFIGKNKQAGRKIYCKFHPREEQTWDVFKDCVVLDKNIGAESLYLSLLDFRDNIEIVGVKSAGLMNAKKLGFKVTTLFNGCGEENADLVKFFTTMGCNFWKAE